MEKSAVCVRRMAYLLDPSRVCVRAAVRIAALAPTRPAPDALNDWIGERVEDACRALVQADVDAEAQGGVPSANEIEEHEFVADLLAVDRALARALAARFNVLPEAERLAFFALAIEGRTVEQCVAAGMGPLDRLRASALAAARTLWSDDERASAAPRAERRRS